ncbi:hypothetical protein D9613_009193 [Agrocybe pediades]|uniref:Protein kinase domain-containing protein n=1 Tax=Agrocybe pediades TaxID=84607 RepID=A0A8H4VVU2_9AGAR|nr:hypothetical protein D9613_009193 [Agrocybe pediades]
MGPEISQCKPSHFQSHYAPFNVPKEQVSEIALKLLKDEAICTWSGGIKGVFRPFDKPLPSLETTAYLPLENITKAIATAASGVQEFASTRTQNYVYRHCPSKRIHSDIAGSNNEVDAHEPSAKVKGKVCARDIASVLEFRTKEMGDLSNSADNNVKVVSANVQIMNEDPRRMFSYRFTIEGYEMSMWYFCRSHSVEAGSLSLNDPNHLKRLVTILTSFMFATDEEMGYDPTITLHEANGKTQYTYRIPGSPKDRFFRTTGTIDDYRSLNITGRRTPPTEKEIQQSIFANIEEFLGCSILPPKKADLAELRVKHAHLLKDEAFKRYFMTIVTDYKGCETRLYDKDRMSVIPDILETNVLPSKFAALPDRQEISVNRRPGLDAEAPAEHKYATKRQYRVVFQELCTEVGKLETLGEVMDVLEEILIPLQLMHCAGWVHRDISCGNILAYKADDRWQAKLSDLEYAKKFSPQTNDTESKDPKTGTPDFMPYEILKREYIRISDREVAAQNALAKKGKGPVELLKEEIYARGVKSRGKNSSGGQANTVNDSRKTSYTVAHNPQHDVESLFWLGLWTATLRVDHDVSRQWAHFIFRHTLTLTTARKNAFEKDIYDPLLTILDPDIAEPFALAFELFRTRLRSDYIEREKADDVFDLNTYKDVYLYAAEFFEAIQTSSNWRQLKLTNPPRDPPRAKRPRTISKPPTASGSGEPQSESSTSARRKSSKRPKV